MSNRIQLSISKTDYKVARSCATKPYYRMNKYPSIKDEDAYIELLAEGGYMIGALLADELDWWAYCIHGGAIWQTTLISTI
jgi:hypothetical protein